MKILILKPSSLGDVIQALPVLRLLKRHFPNAEIFWWIDSNLAPLLEGDPDLAGLFRFQRQRWASPLYWPELVRSLLEMRRQHFDWVIDLQGLARSGAVAWLANGDLTAGVADPREGAFGFYDIAVSRPSYFTHAADWYLEVLRRLETPVDENFRWLPERPAVAAALDRKWNASASRWIIINPGARWSNKRWPVEYFAGLVKMLAADFPEHRFAILGGNADVPLAEVISAACPNRCLNLAGRTSLVEMVEWIRLGEVLVTNDTGPMHVGAALGRPVVAMFGPTEPRRTGPYGQVERALRIALPCAPCLKATCSQEKQIECLRAIPPGRVRQEVAACLAPGPA